jgi:translocator protein
MAKRKKHIKKRVENKKGFWKYMKNETSFRKIHWITFVICMIIVFAVAGIGSLLTNVGSWYESIKPPIAPPNFVFPIVWTLLFYLIGVSLYYSWTENPKEKRKKIAIYYGINFIFNILWSFLFFFLQSPKIALGEILLLWVSIFAMIMFNWKHSRKAAYFLIPYLLWVSFAVVLNYMAIK